MMESVSDVDSNQQINIIVQLLEDDDVFTNIQNPSISIQQLKQKNELKCHFDFKKSLLVLFSLGYTLLLYYSFQILFFNKIHWENNIWLWTVIITFQDLASVLSLFYYICKPIQYLKYILCWLSGTGTLLLCWGLYELFHGLAIRSSLSFLLLCILVLTNIAFYSSCITWLIITPLL